MVTGTGQFDVGGMTTTPTGSGSVNESPDTAGVDLDDGHRVMSLDVNPDERRVVSLLTEGGCTVE